MTSNGPYLSVVVAARNDDHGGNQIVRIQNFVDSLVEQCRRNQLRTELLIVEWNPPVDRPKLREAISWPSKLGPCTIRLLEVTPTIHHKLQNADLVRLFQMIAKNVGIRRASGDFILATNVDLLFTEQLVQHMATKRFEPGKYYRVNRYDVPSRALEFDTLAERLAFCKHNILRIFLRDGTYSFLTKTFYRIYPRPWGFLGRLLLVFERVYADCRRVAWLFLRDAAVRSELLRLEHYRIRIKSGHYKARLSHLFHFVTSQQRARLHTNASGDFTLMAREHWFSLRGYPELPIHAIHLDSILCYSAHYLPLQEVVLSDPMRIYHVDHLGSWTPEPTAVQTFDTRLRDEGIPHLSHEQLNEYAINHMSVGHPLILNDRDWGLATENLSELTLSDG